MTAAVARGLFTAVGHAVSGAARGVGTVIGLPSKLGHQLAKRGRLQPH